MIARRDIFELRGDPIRKHQTALLIAHMLLDEIPLATIRFLAKVYPLFLDQPMATAREMAKAYQCAPSSASRHIHKLTDIGYFERVHYRAWEINSSYLTQLNKM